MENVARIPTPPEAEQSGLAFDPDDLTIGEMEQFEDVVGQTMTSALSDPSNMSAKALKAIVWIVNRRTNPEYTLEDAASVKVSSLDVSSVEGNA
jgi:hypothetical protein